MEFFAVALALAVVAVVSLWIGNHLGEIRPNLKIMDEAQLFQLKQEVQAERKRRHDEGNFAEFVLEERPTAD